MPPKLYKFKDQLSAGEQGEKLIYNLSPEEFENFDSGKVNLNRKGDLITKWSPNISDLSIFSGWAPQLNPVKIEVKSDSHKKAKIAFATGQTPNEFHEEFSQVERQIRGGAWQAKDHGTLILIYQFYIPELDIHEASIYRVDQLLDRLQTLISSKKYRGHLVRNNGYNTLGYAIPRTELSDIAVQVDLKKPGIKFIPIFESLLSRGI